MKKDLVNIIFGDSIAYGLYDYEYYGWPTRIRKKLDEQDINNYLVNLSIPGQNSNDILNRFENEILPRYNHEDTFYLIFSFGIKDALLLNKDKKHQETFQNNLEKIIDISKKYTTNIYFLGLLELDLEKRSEYIKNNINIINNILKETCKIKKTKYIDMTNIINIKDLSDGLHPNELGHTKISDYLYKEIYKDIL